MTIDQTCPDCATSVRRESSYCHYCGAMLATDRTRQGRVYLVTAFLLEVAFPIVGIIIGTALSLVVGRGIDTYVVLESIPAFLVFLSEMVFFYFAYRGHYWARIPIGIYLFLESLGSLFELVSLPLEYTFPIGRIIWAIVYLALGLAIIRSENVKAYIKYRANRSAQPLGGSDQG